MCPPPFSPPPGEGPAKEGGWGWRPGLERLARERGLELAIADHVVGFKGKQVAVRERDGRRALDAGIYRVLFDVDARGIGHREFRRGPDRHPTPPFLSVHHRHHLQQDLPCYTYEFEYQVNRPLALAIWLALKSNAWIWRRIGWSPSADPWSDALRMSEDGPAPGSAGFDPAFPADLAVEAIVIEQAKKFGLSSREAEVLRLILQGKNATTITTELDLKNSTVKTHIRSILTKCGCNSQHRLLSSLLDQKIFFAIQ